MISANHKCLFFILLIVGIFRGYQCKGSDEENVGSNIEEGWEIVSGHEIEEDSLSKGNEKEMYPDRRESKMYPDRRESSKSKTSRELVSKGNEKEMYPDRRESMKEKKTGGKPKTMRGLEIKEDFLKKENSERKVKEEKTGDHTVSYLKMFLESKTLLEAFDIAYKYLTKNSFEIAKKSFKIDILRIAFAYFHYIYNTIVNLILTTYDASIEDFNYAYFNLTIDDYKNTIDDYKNTINDFDDAINDFDDEPKKDVYNSIFNIVLQELQKIDLKVATTLMNIEEFKEKYKNRTLPKKYYNIKIPN